MKQIIIFIILVLSLNIQAQQYHRIYGKVIDERTQKPVKRAPIKVLPYNRMVETDSKGSFIFEMTPGKQELEIDYQPFEKKQIIIELQKDTNIIISLKSPFASQYIEEVEIVSSTPVSESPASVERIDAHVLEKIPAVLGERDVLKAFALTSGVTSGSEGSSEIQVRGGSHGQNLFLLDGVPLYSTMHAFGMLSVYNPVIIKSARLYKSFFPAEYGGKLSSVVNVLTKDANTQKFSGEAEVGLLSSKLAMNFPLIKDKLGLQISGRLSNYAIANLTGLFFDPEDTKLSLHFADLNGNLLWKLNDKNKLRLNFFHNADGIDVGQLDAKVFNSFWLKNAQQNIGLQWQYDASPKVNLQSFIFADRYLFDFGHSQKSQNQNYASMIQILSGITTIGAEEKINIKLNDFNQFQGGVFMKQSTFSPIETVISDSVEHRSGYNKQSKGTEFGGYASWHAAFFNNKHQLDAGIRTSMFMGDNIGYFELEPRLNYLARITDNLTLSASVSRMSQPIHRIANSGVGIAFEIFAPSGKYLKPSSAMQYSLGIARDFSWKGLKIGLRADAWYKSLENLIEFKDGYDARTVVINGVTDQVSDLVTQGSGKAYGIDFSADISHKKWSVTADYTLMKAQNKFEELNKGEYFAASTDIRNTLSLTGTLRISTQWTFNATWQYQTGRPVTIPTSMIYPSPDIYTGELFTDFVNFNPVYTERNNFRMKDFHKLDLSFQYKYVAFKNCQASWTFGLYNAYNQANPYIYYIGLNDKIYDYDPINHTYLFNKNAKPVLKSLSMFPVLPVISWNVKF